MPLQKSTLTQRFHCTNSARFGFFSPAFVIVAQVDAFSAVADVGFVVDGEAGVCNSEDEEERASERKPLLRRGAQHIKAGCPPVVSEKAEEGEGEEGGEDDREGERVSEGVRRRTASSSVVVGVNVAETSSMVRLRGKEIMHSVIITVGDAGLVIVVAKDVISDSTEGEGKLCVCCCWCCCSASVSTSIFVSCSLLEGVPFCSLAVLSLFVARARDPTSVVSIAIIIKGNKEV